MLVSTASKTLQQYIDLEGPDEVPEAQKFTRVKFQRRQNDVPRTVGSIYAVAVAYLDNHGKLLLDAHMFFITKQINRNNQTS